MRSCLARWLFSTRAWVAGLADERTGGTAARSRWAGCTSSRCRYRCRCRADADARATVRAAIVVLVMVHDSVEIVGARACADAVRLARNSAGSASARYDPHAVLRVLRLRRAGFAQAQRNRSPGSPRYLAKLLAVDSRRSSSRSYYLADEPFSVQALRAAKLKVNARIHPAPS